MWKITIVEYVCIHHALLHNYTRLIFITRWLNYFYNIVNSGRWRHICTTIYYYATGIISSSRLHLQGPLWPTREQHTDILSRLCAFSSFRVEQGLQHFACWSFCCGVGTFYSYYVGTYRRYRTGMFLSLSVSDANYSSTSLAASNLCRFMPRR